MLWYLSQKVAPIEGETLEGNIKEGLEWYRFLLTNGLDVVAPYFGLLQALDEFKPEERALGMKIDNLVKPRCDGLVSVGPWERLQKSRGAMEDVEDCKRLEKPWLDLTDTSREEIERIIKYDQILAHC